MSTDPRRAEPARVPAPRRARPGRRAACLALAAALVLAGGIAGCGRRSNVSPLSFEELSDTTGITRGAPILTALEPYRITGDALRIRGRAELPDGTRLQITIAEAATGKRVDVVQVTVRDRKFETAPLWGERGPLPPALYRFVVETQFNPAWQPEQVLRATENGRSLHGPGMKRGTAGQPAFYLTEEHRL